MGPYDGTEKQNCDFLENGSDNFDYIPVRYGDHHPK
jgi:hypothetical protein